MGRQNGVMHCSEVSAVTGEGLNNLFLKLANQCYEKRNEFEMVSFNDSFVLDKDAVARSGVKN